MQPIRPGPGSAPASPGSVGAAPAAAAISASVKLAPWKEPSFFPAPCPRALRGAASPGTAPSLRQPAPMLGKATGQYRQAQGLQRPWDIRRARILPWGFIAQGREGESSTHLHSHVQGQYPQVPPGHCPPAPSPLTSHPCGQAPPKGHRLKETVTCSHQQGPWLYSSPSSIPSPPSSPHHLATEASQGGSRLAEIHPCRDPSLQNLHPAEV